MANKSISQLTSAAAVAETDLLATAIVDGGSATGYATRKHTVADVGAHIGTTKTFAGLNTTSKNLVGAINEEVENFADEYDDTATYSVGDIVTYSGDVYVCSTAVSVAESFDITKWTRTNIAGLIKGIVKTKVVSGTLDANSYLDGTGILLTDAVLGVVAYDPTTDQTILGAGAYAFPFANVALGTQTLRFLNWNFQNQFANKYIKCTVAYIPTA